MQLLGSVWPSFSKIGRRPSIESLKGL